jgi:cysteine-rich repeat protein
MGKIAPCSTATCTNAVCGSTPDTSSTAACTFGTGTAGVCSGGKCGTCGNGATDTGEQCDDGNQTFGDGCDPDCTYSCAATADCDDGDPCDGAESCDTSAHKCKAGNPLIDGASCSTGKICLHQSCRPSFCGDGFVHTGTGEECEPPNTATCDGSCKSLAAGCSLTGDWALKLTANVSWGGDAYQRLEYGEGQIFQWAELRVTQTGTTFSANLRPCGLVVPDFKTGAGFGGEWYGITFPDSIFAANLPTFAISGALGGLTPGSTVETQEAAIMLGVTIKTPPGPFATWPDDYAALNVDPFALTDPDGDGRLGITAVAKTGTLPAGSLGAGQPYADPIVDVSSSPFPRANKLDLVVRQTATLAGTLDTCTSMSGAATPPPVIDNHIIGCQTDAPIAGSSPPSSECPASWVSTPDTVRPTYTVITTAADPGATFKAVLMTGSVDCAAVRTALP